MEPHGLASKHLSQWLSALSSQGSVLQTCNRPVLKCTVLDRKRGAVYISTEILKETPWRAGILPGFGGTQRLPRLVGLQKACEMMLTSAPIPAEAGAKLGLVDALVSSAKLMETACQFALGIAEGSKPRNQVGCSSPCWSCLFQIDCPHVLCSKPYFAALDTACQFALGIANGFKPRSQVQCTTPCRFSFLYSLQSCWTLPAHLRLASLRLESLAIRQGAPSHVSSSRWSVAKSGASPKLGRTRTKAEVSNTLTAQ